MVWLWKHGKVTIHYLTSLFMRPNFIGCSVLTAALLRERVAIQMK